MLLSSFKTKRITGFTLVEMLITIVIIALLFMLTVAFGGRTRQAFVSNQLIKNLVLDTRNTRRQSMLISRNSGEAWVYAVGLEIVYDNTRNVWKYNTVKMVDPGQTSTFFVPYPATITSAYSFVPTGNTVILDKDSALNFFQSNGTSVLNCSAKPVRIMFEAVNGSPHIYCNYTDLSANGVAVSTELKTVKMAVFTDGGIGIL